MAIEVMRRCGNCGTDLIPGEWHSCPTSEAVENDVAKRIAAWLEKASPGNAHITLHLAAAIRRGEWRK